MTELYIALPPSHQQRDDEIGTLRIYNFRTLEYLKYLQHHNLPVTWTFRVFGQQFNGIPSKNVQNIFQRR